MKALTIQQPWAQLCVVGTKRIETRTWPTDYRGPLAIHAAKGLSMIGGARMLRECLVEQPMPEDKFFAAGLERWEGELPLSAIVGTVVLADCVPAEQARTNAQDRALGMFDEGWWAWTLTDPVVFDQPIPASGRLGFWEWDERSARG